MKLVLATQNAHKVSELRAVLPIDWTVGTAVAYGLIDELPETGRTLEHNAAQKAQFVWTKLGIPCLADDSGLEVAALDGAPGVDSAYFGGPAKSDALNRARLVAELDGVSDRRAQFRTVLAWSTPEGVALYEGVVQGVITTEPRGTQGFGYDALFVPDDGDGRTFAEMNPDEKQRLSHRSRAVAAWLSDLRKS